MVKGHRADDKRYISDHNLWHTLLCPIKRVVDNRREFAYLVNGAAADGSITIFHGNIWNPKKEDKEQRFESVDALLDAGWELD